MIGCVGESKISIQNIPIEKGGFYLKNNDWKYTGEDVSMTDIGKEILKDENGKKKLFGIAQFELNEMDSSQIRPFKLVLFELVSESESSQIFATLNKTNNSVISSYKFNSNSLILDAIYSHSSELDHDGIAIEFIEDKSTIDKPKVLGHHVEVFETGEIKYISEYQDLIETFNLLPSRNERTGNYHFSNKDLTINFELKDGIENDSYAYKVELASKKGCRSQYSNLKYELDSDEISLDSLGKLVIRLKKNEIIIFCDSYETGCEETLKLNYVLNEN